MIGRDFHKKRRKRSFCCSLPSCWKSLERAHWRVFQRRLARSRSKKNWRVAKHQELTASWRQTLVSYDQFFRDRSLAGKLQTQSSEDTCIRQYGI